MVIAPMATLNSCRENFGIEYFYFRVDSRARQISLPSRSISRIASGLVGPVDLMFFITAASPTFASSASIALNPPPSMTIGNWDDVLVEMNS